MGIFKWVMCCIGVKLFENKVNKAPKQDVSVLRVVFIPMNPANYRDTVKTLQDMGFREVKRSIGTHLAVYPKKKVFINEMMVQAKPYNTMNITEFKTYLKEKGL